MDADEPPSPGALFIPEAPAGRVSRRGYPTPGPGRGKLEGSPAHREESEDADYQPAADSWGGGWR